MINQIKWLLILLKSKGFHLRCKNILLASIIAIPFTILEVSAAGNTDKLKNTIIDKTIQKFEDGFNSMFTNTE